MTYLKQPWRTLCHYINPDCAFCGETRIPGYPLCQHCHAELPWLLPAAQPPLYDNTTSISAFAYQAPISSLLLGIKFGKNLRELNTLGELTATGILSQLTQVPQAILPVPLHVARLRQRGFNQALELARPLAQQLGIPLLTHLVQRHKATLPQTELNADRRHHNVQQAFHIQLPISYRHLAIFDDVITTGATARELVTTLHSHGVAHVQVWSCARTIFAPTT